LAALKQRDKQVKLRPVLLLKEVPGFGDYLVCGISTQMKNAIQGLDEILKPDSINNLKQISLVRLAFINTVPKDAIRGKI
jgi:mRNA interferase MazF